MDSLYSESSVIKDESKQAITDTRQNTQKTRQRSSQEMRQTFEEDRRRGLANVSKAIMSPVQRQLSYSGANNKRPPSYPAKP